MKYISLFFICLLTQVTSPTLCTSSKVGIDNNGDGIAIFQNASTGFIKSGIYTSGSWNTATTISTSGLFSSNPLLAFDVTSGYAAALWLSIDTTNGVNLLYGSIYSPIAG